MTYIQIERQRRAFQFLIFTGLFALLVTPPSFAASSLPEDITVEGRLYSKISGAPLNDTVDVRLSIVDESDTNCVLYREGHSTVDLSANETTAQGLFSLRLGAGTSEFQSVSLGALFAPGLIPGVGGCSVVAVPGSHRLVRLEVKYPNEPAYEILTPDSRVTSVPVARLAENAINLQGVGTSSLLVLNGSTGLQQTNFDYLFTTGNYAKLRSLVDGGSPQYIPSAPISVVNLNAQRLTNVAAPTSASDVVIKQYADANVAGEAINTDAIGPMTGDGAVIQWDSGNTRWLATAPNRSPTGAASGDLTGSYPGPTVATNAITTAKISAGAVTTAKIVSATAQPNRLLITNDSDGATVGFGACAPGEVYAWGAMGWTCTAPSIIAPVRSVAGRTGVVTLTTADIAGLGTAAALNSGTAAGQVVTLNGSAQIPAVNGSLLTDVNAVKLAGKPVSTVAPTAAQILTWNGSRWEAQTPTGATFGSYPANKAFLSPETGIGTPTFRYLTTADLPSTTLTGTGTAGFVSYYTSDRVLAESLIYNTPSGVGINTANPNGMLDVNGTVRINNLVVNGTSGSSFVTSGGYLTVTSNNGGYPSFNPFGLAIGNNRFGFNEVNFWNIAEYPTPGTAPLQGSTTVGFTFHIRDRLLGPIRLASFTNPNKNASTALEVYGNVKADLYASPSDARLKTDVTTLDDALARILNLRGVSYVWLDPARTRERQIGFIAQELEHIYPSVVSTGANGFKSVDYSRMVAPVVEAIKAIYVRITDTDDRVRRVEAENALLKLRLERLERERERPSSR